MLTRAILPSNLQSAVINLQWCPLPSPAYRFGPFVVDRAAYRVLEDGRPLDLTPKLLDLLLHLIEHAGSLVTKEALLDALWPGANVTDNALAQAVSELRQALGDEAGDPRFIKTVARRGYRFVAAVEPVTPPDEPAIAEPTARPEPGRGCAADDLRSIAVLDFTNVTGDAESAWLSAGIAETVSGDLRALNPSTGLGAGRFKVVDRWRVTEAARRTGGSLHDVAAALRVRLVVVGSFQRNGERVRITARVVDVGSGEAVADAKVDGRLDEIFDLQDQVAAQFAQELGVPLGAESQSPGAEARLPTVARRAKAGSAKAAAKAPRSRETASLEAYRAVMEGWLRIETLDVRELPRAIADFERAVAIDARYALAWTGLATAEFASYESTRSENEPSRPLLDRAIAHGRQAVELDDSLAEAHGSLALILVSAWDTAGAIGEARRAVSLEPGNWRHLFRLGHASWGEERLRAGAATLALYPDFAFAYFQSAMVHVARGHLTDAERVLRHGAAIQDRQIGRGERYPALGLHWLLGLVRLAQDDIEDALTEFARERELAEPHRLYGREYAADAALGRGAALLRADRRDEAVASFHDALALYPDHPLGHLGLAVSGSADFHGVEQVLETTDRAKPIESALVRAQVLASRGDASAAADLIAGSLENAPPGFAGWSVPVEPFLRQLTDSKAFAPVSLLLSERAK
jgi:DNA-binding winged helix-turn-helix (wHTH) protein/tetratricopeptide (TPR) repeat protein